MGEAPPTLPILIGFLPNVDVLVGDELGATSEALPAVGTAERPLPLMPDEI